MNAPHHPVPLLLHACALALLLRIGSASAAASTQLTPVSQPFPASDHTPVILRMVERTEARDGMRFLLKDIYFTDAAGDAVVVANQVVGMDPAGGLFFHITDDPITASAEQQKQEALLTAAFSCPATLLDPFSFTIEDRVRDQAGNLSGPVTFIVACAANPPSNVPFLIGGGTIGLLLLLGGWLYFRAHPAERGATMRSILLLFCSLPPATLLQLTFHEGGHALSDPAHLPAGLAVFAHPFAFSAYSRPMFEWSSVWQHGAGAVAVLLGSLLVSLLFWQRRSPNIFALAALFPLAAMNNGFYILSLGGDFRNIQNITGLPPVVFHVVGGAVAAAGVVSLLSLLPLLGLSPGDRRALLVLPAGYFLWGLLSVVVAYLFIPGSPFAVRWHLAGEILQSANAFLWAPLIGLVLAVLHLTLSRWLDPRLPAFLRREPVGPAPRALRLPALLAALSLAAGMLTIL